MLAACKTVFSINLYLDTMTKTLSTSRTENDLRSVKAGLNFANKVRFHNLSPCVNAFFSDFEDKVLKCTAYECGMVVLKMSSMQLHVLSQVSRENFSPFRMTTFSRQFVPERASCSLSRWMNRRKKRGRGKESGKLLLLFFLIKQFHDLQNMTLQTHLKRSWSLKQLEEEMDRRCSPCCTHQ